MTKKFLYIHNTNIAAKTANFTQVISMCNAFCEENNEVTLLLPANSKDKISGVENLKKQYHLNDKLIIKTFANPTKSYKINKNFNFITLFFFLLKNKSFKDHIIFVRSVHYLFVSIISGYNSIYESHNFLVHQGNKLINKVLSKVLIWCFKKDHAKLFIGISENLTNYWIKQGISSKKSLASHDGFSPNAYPENLDKNQLKKELNWSNTIPAIVYTGNIHKNRGINYIIETAKKSKSFNFYIVGGPNELIKYYQSTFQTDNYPNIFFIGQVSHQAIYKYQMAADVLLGIWSKDVPTINYCSPLKLFEYMATANPILAFAYPTIKEVIVDKKNGYLCQPDDVDDMVDKLVYILKDSNKEKIALQAQADAYESYTWNSRVNIIIEKYQCLD